MLYKGYLNFFLLTLKVSLSVLRRTAESRRSIYVQYRVQLGTGRI